MSMSLDSLLMYRVPYKDQRVVGLHLSRGEAEGVCVLLVVVEQDPVSDFGMGIMASSRPWSNEVVVAISK